MEKKKWNNYNSIKREELANKFSPVKPSYYNKTMNPLLDTYKRMSVATKTTKGIIAGQASLGLGLLGAGIRRLRRFK